MYRKRWYFKVIISNNKRLEQLNNISYDDLYILTDFDGTITKDNSGSLWASIFKNPEVTKEFIDKCVKIFNYYYKYEVDSSLWLEEKMLMMIEWYRKNIETLIQFGITEEIMNYAANNEHVMEFRRGTIEFLKIMYKKIF